MHMHVFNKSTLEVSDVRQRKGKLSYEALSYSLDDLLSICSTHTQSKERALFVLLQCRHSVLLTVVQRALEVPHHIADVTALARIFDAQTRS